jgi:5'-AMP-activated protein kinase catalytic alpha subunit
MIEGKQYVVQMSDLSFCGVFLLALVCGCLPFQNQNMHALYQKMFNARYWCPSTLTKECRHILTRILTTDYTKRYPVM